MIASSGLRKTDIIFPLLGWNLGSIEGRIWVGRLEESDYFDFARKHEYRMVTGMSAGYNPSFVPGLTIGLNRIFMTYWKPENLKYILRLFTTSRSNALASSGNDEDQKFSLFADWNLPKVGFTIYGEFGRDDFSSNETTNPFHTAIYTIGVKQYIPLPFGLKSELNLEFNNFEMSQDFQLQWEYLGYYSHHFVNQGYTHNGQVLGGASCWAGNSQFFQYKLYFQNGYTAFKFHRYCPNNNSVYSQAIKNNVNSIKNWYANFETYKCFSLETSFFIKSNCLINTDFTYIRITRSNYTKDEKNNFYLKCLIKYNL